MDNIDWPEEMREFKRATGLKNHDIARLMGVTHDTVASWSCGRSIPRRTTRHYLLSTMRYLSELVENDVFIRKS